MGVLACRNDRDRLGALDWALCELKPTTTASVPSTRFASMAREIIQDAPVWISHDGDSLDGYAHADYSLVALPGEAHPQRMWIVVFDSEIRGFPSLFV